MGSDCVCVCVRDKNCNDVCLSVCVHVYVRHMKGSGVCTYNRVCSCA